MKLFEELDYCRTPLGELILRRRRVASMDDAEVLEVKLDGAFLMSSVVNVSEIALAELVLDEFEAGDLDVAVGGLGLGYTAVAALDHHAVQSVMIIEYLAEVIDWHHRGLVAPAMRLMADPRCRVINGDFFALLNPAVGLDPDEPGRRFHAILLDIDHSPRSVLHPTNSAFYEKDGLIRLSKHLQPRGIFGLWSADPPEKNFLKALAEVFADVRAHEVEFHNPLMHCNEVNTVYVAKLP